MRWRTTTGESSAASRPGRLDGASPTDSAIGTAEFDEIRTVLGQEDLLLPPRSDESIYVGVRRGVPGVAALRRELSCRATFPGWRTWKPSTNLIGQDVDAESAVSGDAAARVRPIRDGPLRVGRTGSVVPREDRQPSRQCLAAARPKRLGNEVPRADAQVAAAGVAGQRGAGGDLSRAGRALCAAGVRRPRAIGHQDGHRSPDSPAPGGAGNRRAEPATVAGVAVRPGEPDAARHLDGRGAAALRLAEGVRRPRARDLHGRSGGMGLVVGTAAHQAASAEPARRADAEAPAQRGAATGGGADFRRPAPAARPAGSRGDRSASSRGFASGFVRKSPPRWTKWD